MSKLQELLLRLIRKRRSMSQSKVILVTGGSGLVGQAIRTVVEADPKPDETWIFLCSKDGDLRFVLNSVSSVHFFLYSLLLLILFSFCCFYWCYHYISLILNSHFFKVTLFRNLCRLCNVFIFIFAVTLSKLRQYLKSTSPRTSFTLLRWWAVFFTTWPTIWIFW